MNHPGHRHPLVVLSWIVILGFVLGLAAFLVSARGVQVIAAVMNGVGWMTAAFLWYTRLNPSGIQWFQRLLLRVRRVDVEARLDMTFIPPEDPVASELVASLREWDGDPARFRVVSEASTDGGALSQLEVQTGQVGRVTVQRVLVDDGSYAYEEGEYVLTLPDHPYELGFLISLLSTRVEDLLHAVGETMGEPTGMNLDVTLDPRRNPFYSAYLRDDVARVGVTAFNVSLRPTGSETRVDVGTDAVVIHSTNRPEFIRVASAFLGMRA